MWMEAPLDNNTREGRRRVITQFWVRLGQGAAPAVRRRRTEPQPRVTAEMIERRGR
jgi:hypothetical protein